MWSQTRWNGLMISFIQCSTDNTRFQVLKLPKASVYPSVLYFAPGTAFNISCRLEFLQICSRFFLTSLVWDFWKIEITNYDIQKRRLDRFIAISIPEIAEWKATRSQFLSGSSMAERLKPATNTTSHSRVTFLLLLLLIYDLMCLCIADDLIVRSALREDAGTYECRAISPAGFHGDSATVQLATLPKISLTQSKTIVARGDSVTFECKVRNWFEDWKYL